MSTTTHDGAVIYSYPDNPQDILFNGKSTLHMKLVEVKRYTANGWGYILCLRTIDELETPEEDLTEIEPMIDGQYLTHTYYGFIEVIP